MEYCITRTATVGVSAVHMFAINMVGQVADGRKPCSILPLFCVYDVLEHFVAMQRCVRGLLMESVYYTSGTSMRAKRFVMIPRQS